MALTVIALEEGSTPVYMTTDTHTSHTAHTAHTYGVLVLHHAEAVQKQNHVHRDENERSTAMRIRGLQSNDSFQVTRT